MAIGFFLEYGGTVVQFPINPETVAFEKESNNEVTEVVSLGEINRLGFTSLGEVEFESYLPGNKSRFGSTNNKFLKPKQIMDFIEKIRREKKPCRFIVSDTFINFLASIESFTPEIRAGEEEDIYFTIMLKEYKPYEAKQVKVVQQISTPKKPQVTKKAAKAKSTNKAITPGTTVIVNGRLHRDSYGKGPGKTEKNARRKINFIKKGRKYPYHVTMLDGGWRGWVTSGSVKRVD